MVMRGEQEALVLEQKGSVVSLLSAQGGRVEAIFYATRHLERLYPGSHVACVLEKKQNRMLLVDVYVQHVPLVQARQDIFFLHYLLDICIHFFPLGMQDEQVYAFLMQILNQFERIQSSLEKKQILCFFSCLSGHLSAGRKV